MASVINGITGSSDCIGKKLMNLSITYRITFAFLKSFVVLLVSLNILWLALKNLPERYVKYLSSVIVIGVLLPRAGVEVILLHLERSLIQNADFPTPEWFRLSLVCFLFSPWIFLYAAIAYLKFGRIKTVV